LWIFASPSPLSQIAALLFFNPPPSLCRPVSGRPRPLPPLTHSLSVFFLLLPIFRSVANSSGLPARANALLTTKMCSFFFFLAAKHFLTMVLPIPLQSRQAFCCASPVFFSGFPPPRDSFPRSRQWPRSLPLFSYDGPPSHFL